jgi:hypothetical protein
LGRDPNTSVSVGVTPPSSLVGLGVWDTRTLLLFLLFSREVLRNPLNSVG